MPSFPSNTTIHLPTLKFPPTAHIHHARSSQQPRRQRLRHRHSPTTEGFFLKGLAHLDWGMKDRLARIFNPKSGHTVMLAFDHGYIMGPTSGPGADGPHDRAADPLRRLPDVYPRGLAADRAADVQQADLAPRLGRLDRAHRTERRVHLEHRGMPPPERLDGRP